MSDYNKYVLAVNTIFEGIEKMKTNWTNQDNINYIETIEEYRQIVIDEAKRFSEDKSPEQNKVEVLGND